jgi:cytochrome P450
MQTASPAERSDGTATTATVPLTWDPALPAFRADPHPFYDRLRAEAPALYTPLGNVVLTRYHDVAATLRSPDFSRDVDANATWRDDPVFLRRRERRRGAKTILHLDPPDHTRLRRLVSQAFTPSAIERLRPRVQQLVDDSLDRAAEAGAIELIDELAFPVPFQVISDLLDMPTGRADELRAWSQTITASLEPGATLADLDAADAALAEMVPLLVDVVEHRRHHLGDDVLSSLIRAEEAGDRLDLGELIAFVTLLYVAGHETTVNLIGNGVLALLRHPDELRRWRDDPSLTEGAIDELLRYDGPVQHTVRVPLVPVSFGEGDQRVDVAPGTIVTAVLGAANHDPAVFDDPHRLRLDRPNAHRHLAFAAGIHYCLGASLAKLEAAVAIGTLVRRFPVMVIAEAPAWRDRVAIRGVERLALQLR